MKPLFCPKLRLQAFEMGLSHLGSWFYAVVRVCMVQQAEVEAMGVPMFRVRMVARAAAA